MKIKPIFFFSVLFIIFCFATKQNKLYSQKFVFEDAVYDENIKTVLLFRPGFELSFPIIELNSNEKLELVFDDLNSEWKQYKYSIELCNADWTASTLMKSEYIKGFFEDFIVDFNYSRNTRIPYVNYSLTFPNENMMPLYSGNYILKVFYEEGNNQILAFTKRFYILDKKLDVNMNVTASNDTEARWTKQELNFIVDYSNFNIINPNTNLIVNVKQNARTDNIKTNVRPRIIRTDRIEYALEREDAFWGGNEFRNFDIKSLRYVTSEIQEILKVDDVFLAVLNPDVRRNMSRYSHRNDINGRFLIKTDDQPNTRTEAEYVFVSFSLMSEFPRTDGEVYLSGSFLNWKLDDTSKMKYNYRRKSYEAQLLLKQGFYDYQYVFLPNDTKVADIKELEGSFFTTSNEYSVWVYYRQPGQFRDELLSISFFNTRN